LSGSAKPFRNQHMWLFAIEIRYIWRVGKANSKLQIETLQGK